MTVTLLAAGTGLGIVWYLGGTVAMPAALLWSPAYVGVLDDIARVHARIMRACWLALLTCLADLLSATLPVPTTACLLRPLATRPTRRLLLPTSSLLRAPPQVS
ncbi:hypothetical protein [Nitrospira sp. Kam-Ns4a]